MSNASPDGPRFRYVRRPWNPDEEPPPTLMSQAVLGLKLGAILAVILTGGFIYASTYAGARISERAANIGVLVAFLLPSAIVLARGWWLWRRRKRAEAEEAQGPRLRVIERPGRRLPPR